MSHAAKSDGPLLLAASGPSASARRSPGDPIDILVGADGRIAKTVGPSLQSRRGARDGSTAEGAFVSPGWIDLHAHVWHGGTDISIRPQLCGVERGVTTIVDAGSAGEANFHGFREYVIEPAPRAHPGLSQHRLDRPRRLQPGQRADRHALDRRRPHPRGASRPTATSSSASRCGRATSSSAPGASRRSRSPRRWPRS